MATSSEPAKKSAAKKSTARKSTPKEASQPPAKQSAAAPRQKKMSAADVGREAAEQLLELTGRQPEGITALERTDDGWRVQVQVVEVRRIPETTDVVALYDVEMDTDGDLQGYRRVRRYTRGEPGED